MWKKIIKMQSNYFMHEALKEGGRASKKEEVPVGALIVYKGKIIAQKHNLVRKNVDPTAHAEILCIREAAKSLLTHYLNECDIYTTLEPCAMCAQAIAFSKIKRLYFGAYDEKFGAIESGARIFNTCNANHVPEIYGGIEQDKASEMLRDFFAKKRNNLIV
jgi:cytosine deaminase